MAIRDHMHSVQVPVFMDIVVENGGEMPHCLESHALWHYYITMANVLWQVKNEHLGRIIGEGVAVIKEKELFHNIMDLHKVNIEQVRQLWPALEKEVKRQGLTPLPEKYKMYRLLVLRG